MISELLEVLKADDRIYAWNLKAITKDSYQLFFIKQKLDMNRESVTNNYTLSIFVKKGEKLGNAKFDLYSSMSIDEIQAKIDEQIQLCTYTLNDMYKFPKKVNIKPITKDSLFDSNKRGLKEMAFIVADSIFEADKYVSGYLNSSEIFISKITTRFFDSNGNVFLYTGLVGEVELVATWRENNFEVEQYKYFKFDELNAKKIHEEANELLLQASERIKAIKTPEINNYKLLLSKECASEFFWLFAKKASADSIYNLESTYHVGSNIQRESKSDLLDIYLESTMKNSTEGAPFDDDGVLLKKLHIIEKGTVKNLWGSNDKSQYLKLPVHGKYENIMVGPGTLNEEELENENYVEIVSVSGFDIDPVTGDFGSEIRLAYLHSKNKPVVAVTGGSFSGNVFKSLSTALFSKDIIQKNNYIGPKSVYLGNISFNKGE